MDYLSHYNRLIQRGKTRVISEYTESHHITPRCLGGRDGNDNIVKLTPREHYIAHLLLVKMYPTNNKLIFAANMMTVGSRLNNRDMSLNRTYGWLRKKFATMMSELQSGVNNSQYGKRWVIKDDVAVKVDKSEVDHYLKDGWKRGRVTNIKPQTQYKRKPKPCGRCGMNTCTYSDICRKTNMIKTLIKFFEFDERAVGTSLFYGEYFRIKKVIEDEYHTNKLSTVMIAEKYKIPSTQRVDSIFKSLGIKKRGFSEAGKIFYDRSIV